MTDAAMYAARLVRLRAAMTGTDLDALYVTHPANRRYLTGYTGEDHPPEESAGAVLVTGDAAYLRTGATNAPQAAAEAAGCAVIGYSSADEAATQLREIVALHQIARIGIEENALTVAAHDRLHETLDSVTLIPAGSIATDLRLIKDAAEIALLRRAQEITVAAFASVASRLTVGMTEKEIAWELEMAVRAHGGDGLGFSTIVGAGPHGARPHHTVTDRPVQAGEPIVIDMGARYAGYSGDLTRTIVIGEPDEQFRRVYDAVLRAMRHAEEIARPGMMGGELDAAARAVIEDAGYGQAIIHGLGHGIGLQVHEAPSARKDGADIFRPGMTLTIEPGVYLPDWGGVRIEDLVVFTEAGIEVVAPAPVVAV